MQIGIIGLPNVGKSTLFNALTKLSVPAENFPFTTIDPNVGVVAMPDERLKKLGELFKPEKLTAASITFVDIAGLVAGASKGEGLGNKFLSHIREMDALVQVVRGFGATDVVNVLGHPDPEKEKSVIETELILSDLDQLTRIREKIFGSAKSGDKHAKERYALLDKVGADLNAGVPIRRQNMPQAELAEYQFLTAKPVLYVVNVGENAAAQPSPHGDVTLSAKIEAELAQLPPEEQQSFRKEMGIGESGLDRLIKAGKKLLNLITFYTVVGTEVRAWNIPAGSTLVSAAGRIHTDMAKGFVKGEVYNYSDLSRLGSEKALQEKGLIRGEGRDYPVKDGDIVRIHFR